MTDVMRGGDEDDPTGRMAELVLDRAGSLANALREAADKIEDSARAGVIEHPDRRRELGFDDTLEGVGDAQRALNDVGDDLVAIAAVAGYPMKRLGELIGLSESAVPVRLAKTRRLAPYVRKGGSQERVGRPELGAAAWDFRRGGSAQGARHDGAP